MLAFASRFASGVPQMSRASGVPHIRTARSVSVVPCEPSSVPLPEALASIPVGVGQFPASRREGQEPESLAKVGGSNVGRSEQTPFRIEPETGKVFEDVGESSDSASGVESRDVLQEHETGSHVSNDLRDPRPEPTIIVSSSASARSRPGLAREAGSDEIHSLTPRGPVEGLEVVPDGAGVECSGLHVLGEDGGGVGIALDSADDSDRESGESEPELHSAVPGAGVDDGEGSMCIHVSCQRRGG